MTGTPLLIGPDEVQALRALRELASQNPVDMAKLMPTLLRRAGKKKHLERMQTQTIPLPMAYLVTYSVEFNHPHKRTARHMSMSVLRDGRLPNQQAVWMVCEELGFTGDLDQCAVWLEALSDGGMAVNVVQVF